MRSFFNDTSTARDINPALGGGEAFNIATVTLNKGKVCFVSTGGKRGSEIDCNAAFCDDVN